MTLPEAQPLPALAAALAAPLGVVVPTLNAAPALGETLAALRAGAGPLAARLFVVVADGGSTDGTPGLAGRLGARVIAAPRGRGVQLGAGAGAAIADGAGWLLFLHADTRLAPGWGAAAAAFIADPANALRAGYCRFRLDDAAAPAARRLERAVAWRCRRLALPYGDQALLLSAAFYRALGGFRPIPIMEDVDLIRRIGRCRLVALPADAITSATKWRRQGYLRRSARNLACLSLWFAGLPPRAIARLYG